MNRPTDRELNKKIEEAKEIWALIQDLLEEIKPEDYAGGRPPQKSYEKTIEGRELFAFSWWSKKLDKKMYIKFSLKNNQYYYVSLHVDKKEIVK